LQARVIICREASDKSRNVVADEDRRHAKGIVMGQASVELPEAPEAAGPAEAPAADDMLAQLAGAEIDRLLAEAEDGGSPASPDPAPDIEVASENLPAEAAEPASPPLAHAAVTNESDARNIDTEIAQGIAIGAASSTVEDSPSRIAPDSPALASQEGSSGNVPRSAPAESVAGDDDGPPPLFMRILEFLNSPLDSFPDSVRETIGKIALGTLANAIAMLVYVRLFRHK
jgi:hypothetical protein